MTKSNYPFTEGSTRKIANGLLLPRGIILGCLLSPKTTGKINYGWVSRIYCNPDTTAGLMDIKSDSGDLLCTVKFSLTAATAVIVGDATDSNGDVCGCITASAALIPFFYASYELDAKALILTPSALRVINTEPIKPYTTVKYNKYDVALLKHGYNLPGKPQKDTSPYISEIIINDTVHVKGAHVSITTDCGGLRVVNDAGIKIGRFCDVNE